MNLSVLLRLCVVPFPLIISSGGRARFFPPPFSLLLPFVECVVSEAFLLIESAAAEEVAHDSVAVVKAAAASEGVTRMTVTIVIVAIKYRQRRFHLPLLTTILSIPPKQDEVWYLWGRVAHR